MYKLRQYPVFGGANHFYETSKIDPSIPGTVFTTSNITFLLFRETKVESKKTKITPIPKDNAWTKRMKTQRKTVTVSPTSPDTTVTSLQKKNEMLQA